MPLITSANVACGVHAGDPSARRRTCASEVQHGVSIGAQVSYPDLSRFGRRFVDMQPDEFTDAVITVHAAADYIVAFCGFLPGFAHAVNDPADMSEVAQAAPTSVIRIRPARPMGAQRTHGAPGSRPMP